jgi:hypothetical protein
MPVILLVLKDSEGNLSFFVNPEWRKIVHGQDSDYLKALFKDFLVRAKLHPALLFKQLCSLAVGPFETHKVSTSSAQPQYLKKLLSGFVKL